MLRPVALVVALSVFSPAARAETDPLTAALQQKAPAVLEHARQKGFTNLGVLKFLVDPGDGKLNDSVGDLNQSLANKTEIALILANTDERFGIIDRASEFVAREKMTSANHLTESGRRAFFTRKFDLAWSQDKVEPCGFVTGVATVSGDRKRMTVRLRVFDRTGKEDELPGELTAPTDPEALAQAGFSYRLPPARQKALVAGGPAPSRDELRAEAIDEIVRASRPAADAPFAPLAECPVKWTVLYNGKAVPVKGDTVPEPGPDDRVAFVLKNPGSGTYAAVLLVNGENTLYQERAAPIACRKWVLGPGDEVTVSGFQTGKDVADGFRVLPAGEPLPDAVRYGDHAGTFRLVVYHGKVGAAGAADDTLVRLTDEERAALTIARTRGGTSPAGAKPQSLRALKATLRGRVESAAGTRGYVVKGEKAERFATEVVSFTPSSDVPVADVSLRYVAPGK